MIAYVPQTEEVDWNFPVLVSDVVMMGRYGKMGFLRIPGKEDKKLSPMHWNVSVLRAGSPPDRRAFRRPEKRVFLARALAQNGKVLLLDEPFTGVDVKTENAIIDLLRSLREEGHLVLVSTHNLGSVPEFCDHVILINRTVLDSGPTATTFTQKNTERTFGGVLRHINLSGRICMTTMTRVH